MEIVFQRKSKEADQFDIFTMVCNQAPVPELLDSIKKLKNVVPELCGIEIKDGNPISVYGVAFGYDKEENIKCMVLARKKTAAGSFNINTPLLPECKECHLYNMGVCQAACYSYI